MNCNSDLLSPKKEYISKDHIHNKKSNPKYHLSIRTLTVVHWCSPWRITKAINCECETCMRVGERHMTYLIYGAILQLYPRLYINVKRILSLSTFGPVMLLFSLFHSIFLHTGILYCKRLWIAPYLFQCEISVSQFQYFPFKSVVCRSKC